MAIIAVVLVHAWEGSWEVVDSPVERSSLLFQGVMLARYGVELFFVLSGWLIFALYYKQSAATARSYWSRRIARIWPLWAVFVAATVVATTWTLLTFPQNLPDSGRPPSLLVVLLLALLFLGWLNPFTWQVPPGGWSIQVEAGHYLLFWPLRHAKPLLLVSTALAGYLTYFVARALAARPPEVFGTEFARDWIRLGLYGTWPFFLAGGLAFLWSRRNSTRRLPALTPPSVGVIGGALGILLLAFVVPVPLGKSYEAALVTVALLIATLVAARWQPARRILASLGAYSYFMYFSHFWVIAGVLLAVRSLDSRPVVSTYSLLLFALALFALSLALSWAAGRLSWHYFEGPILRAARRSA